jgi:hypothetical protein
MNWMYINKDLNPSFGVVHMDPKKGWVMTNLGCCLDPENDTSVQFSGCELQGPGGKAVRPKNS